jgi:outer membrane protein OmpA-like peptidoglycan-associated protein
MSCDPEELCEECPEWIFTLADLLMCMMGLFVILWVLKPDVTDDPVQQTQAQIDQEELIRDITIAFGARPEDNIERNATIEELKRKLRLIQRNGAGERGNAEREADGAEGTDPEVTTIREGERAGIGGRVNFEPGADTLTDDQRRTLDQIAAKIRGYRNVVLVKGHTSPDDLPALAGSDGTLPPADEALALHLDLSLRRAVVVTEYLVAKGVAAESLRPQACAHFEPVKLRAYSAEDRYQNRRVEIEATDQLVRGRVGN